MFPVSQGTDFDSDFVFPVSQGTDFDSDFVFTVSQVLYRTVAYPDVVTGTQKSFPQIYVN